MKKLLTATTALALVGGAAFAEITISGDAKLGLNYDSEAGDMKSKHSFTHQMGVDFSGSGTTDGGLSFGGSAGFDTSDTETNTGNVWVSGAFGKLTIGDNDAADLLAGGIADVGLDGRGVDDVAEDIRGGSAAQFRYDQSVGNIALAISAGTSGGMDALALGTTAADATADNPIEVVTELPKDVSGFEVKKNSYAIGMNFNAAGATVGLGYDSRKTISAGFGYSTGQISANAFYAKRDQDYYHSGQDGTIGGADAAADAMASAGMTGLGIDVSYTMGASTLTMVYANADVDNILPYWSTADGSGLGTGAATDMRHPVSANVKGMGIGFSHDLGGGAKLVAGFAQVPQMELGSLNLASISPVRTGITAAGAAQDTPDLAGVRRNQAAMLGKITADKNVASIGLSFSF